MDELRFYVLFNSASVISGRWEADNESCVQWSSVFASSGDQTRSARSVGQRLIHWATGAPNKQDTIRLFDWYVCKDTSTKFLAL